MSTDIDYATMKTVARDLGQTGRDLDSAGSSAPGKVDAGIYSSLVLSVMERVTESAAGLAEGMVDAGAGLERSIASYRRVDSLTDHRLGQLDPGLR